MKHPVQWPSVLLRKWLLSIIVAVAILLIGIVLSVAMQDRMLLCLSVALFLASIPRCLLFFGLAATEHYDKINGVCVALRDRPLLHQREVRLLTESGAEHILYLNRQVKLQIGDSYCFYFERSPESARQSEPICSNLLSNHFLAFENLGEYQIHNSADSQTETVKK